MKTLRARIEDYMNSSDWVGWHTSYRVAKMLMYPFLDVNSEVKKMRNEGLVVTATHEAWDQHGITFKKAGAVKTPQLGSMRWLRRSRNE